MLLAEHMRSIVMIAESLCACSLGVVTERPRSCVSSHVLRQPSSLSGSLLIAVRHVVVKTEL